MAHRAFAITAAYNTVNLDDEGQGKVVFTVTNRSEDFISAAASVLADEHTDPSWVTIEGASTRDLPAGSTQQLTVHVSVPEQSHDGESHGFRLEVVSADNPDETSVVGPAVTFVAPERAAAPSPPAPAPPPPEKNFPWSIVGAALVSLLILAAAYLFWPDAAPTPANGQDGPADNVALIHQVIPVGGVVPFFGNPDSLPANWTVCDGKLISAETNYKREDVSDAFWNLRVPDLRGRTIVGAGKGEALSDRKFGETGGEEDHSLTLAEMPSHTHAIIDPGHGHGFAYTGAVGSPGDDADDRTHARATEKSATTNPAKTGIKVQSAGSNTSHNVMQPYLVSHFIIRLK